MITKFNCKIILELMVNFRGHYIDWKLVVGLMLILTCCKHPDEKMTADEAQLDSLVAEDSVILQWTEEDEMLGLGKVQFGDLDSMIERRTIRALVPYTKTYYYIDGGERKGLAFDALNLFEKELNRSLKFYPPKVRIVLIPVSREQLIPLLTQGYGDLIFGGFTITEERKKLIDFSMPTMSGLNEIVVGGPSSVRLSSVADLAGQTIYVHEHSSYQYSLERLNDSLKYVGVDPIIVKLIDPYLEKEDLLEMVQADLIPFTVVENDVAEYWSEIFDSLVVYSKIVVNRNVSYAGAFRKDSPQLKAEVDKFVVKARKGTKVGNILYNKYLKNSHRLKKAHSQSALKQLKTTELTFKKYATESNLDWLLLAAQGYQESGLNQNVKSSAGAVGIMQVKPSTAAGDPINIHHIERMENNIQAGAKYMRYLMDTYFSEDSIDPLNQQLLALAAYNAGPARMAGLRKQAKLKGLDPDQWFNNVEKIVAQEIGRETVQYVSNIYKYYTGYRALAEYSSQSGKKLL